MVNGLNMFATWFEGYEDQYVLIGGTAAALEFNAVGLPFRTTKDLDVVLHIEAITPDFARTFWAFVNQAGYLQRQTSTSSRPKLYRFSKPTDPEYPETIELFSRQPDLDDLAPGHLTPIPFEDEISSLSAIVLDDIYYQFILSSRRYHQGLPPWLGAEGLIPLKAHAWLDLTARKDAGESIDSQKIRKHFQDIIKLSGVLTAESRVSVPLKIANDLRDFIERTRSLTEADHKDAFDLITKVFL